MSEEVKTPETPQETPTPENKEGGNLTPQVDIKADILKEVGDYLLKFENKILHSLTQNKNQKQEPTTKKTNF